MNVRFSTGSTLAHRCCFSLFNDTVLFKSLPVPHLVGECMVPRWSCEGKARPAMCQSRIHRIQPRARSNHTHLKAHRQRREDRVDCEGCGLIRPESQAGEKDTRAQKV